MNKQPISTTRAAQILGLTRQMVGVLLRQGILTGVQLGRVWAVDSDSVEEELKRRQEEGNHADTQTHD